MTNLDIDEKYDWIILGHNNILYLSPEDIGPFLLKTKKLLKPEGALIIDWENIQEWWEYTSVGVYLPDLLKIGKDSDNKTLNLIRYIRYNKEQRILYNEFLYQPIENGIPKNGFVFNSREYRHDPATIYKALLDAGYEVNDYLNYKRKNDNQAIEYGDNIQYVVGITTNGSI